MRAFDAAAVGNVPGFAVMATAHKAAGSPPAADQRPTSKRFTVHLHTARTTAEVTQLESFSRATCRTLRATLRVRPWSDLRLHLEGSLKDTFSV